jgi:hypothetical protein
MISHAVVPCELLSRNILSRLLRLQNKARGSVLRVQKRSHDRDYQKDNPDVEPPGAMQILDGFRLKQVVSDA